LQRAGRKARAEMIKDVKEVENNPIAIQKEKRAELTMRQLSKKERL
jgi:hypothetical protein